MRHYKPSAARLRAEHASLATATDQLPNLLSEHTENELSIRDPATGQVRKLNIAWSRQFPNLAGSILSGVLRHANAGSVRSFVSIEAFNRDLRSGLARFLTETDRTHLALAGLDAGLLHAFLAWLNTTDDGKARLSVATRKGYYHAVVTLLNRLRSDPEHCTSVIEAIDVPNPRWGDRERTSVRLKDDLSEGDLRAICVAAAREVRSISQSVGQDLALLKNEAPTEPATRHRRTVLERARELVRGGAATFAAIRRVDASLAKSIDLLGRDDIMRVALPQTTDLVPFMVLFTIAFRLNSSVLLSATRADFDVRRWVGGDRIFARPFKPRSGQRVTASCAVSDDPLNPARMVDLLDDWLEPARTSLVSQALFERSDPAAHRQTKQRMTDALGEKMITKALNRLARQEGVETSVSLTRIRAAVLDLSHVLSKGDLLKVKAAASHKSARTTSNHYITPAGMAREDEALANAMSAQATMIATSGRFDPRKSPDEPTFACTPGWQCHRGKNPAFGTPRDDGQCTAYGRCPVCVHGHIDVTSERSCAQVHLLVEAIERSIDSMPPAAWLAQLSPIRMHLLTKVLPRFGEDIHRRASLLDLPPLPSLS